MSEMVEAAISPIALTGSVDEGEIARLAGVNAASASGARYCSSARSPSSASSPMPVIAATMRHPIQVQGVYVRSEAPAHITDQT